MEKGIGDQPTNGMAPLPRGLLIGTTFAACAVASWLIAQLVLTYALDRTWLFNLIIGSVIAILAIGYLAGLAAAIKRSTRRLGFGILIGVTVASPALLMTTWVVVHALGESGY